MGNTVPVKAYWREHADLEAEHSALLAPFLADFDLTAAAALDKVGGRTLSVYFLRPRPSAKRSIGFEHELALFISSKRTLSSTTFHAIEDFLNGPNRTRQVELLAYVLVAPTGDLVARVKQYLGDNQRSRMIVPFTRDELRAGIDRWEVRTRFIQSLAARDLFDMQGPLVDDTYYFGRTELIADLINRCRAGENAGLFGLRKTGKTSAAHKVRRHIQTTSTGLVVIIDAQNQGIYSQRWWKLFGELATKLVAELKSSVPAELLPPYDEQDAAQRFESLVRYVLSLRLQNAQRILFIFDEIEHIVPGLRPPTARHWDADFIDFWKTLRAIQTEHRRLSFLVIGVNPMAVEQTSFGGQDNPLFALVGVRYMPSFTRDEVREMVRTIGKPMGMRFSDDAYNYLADRYGGHPMLTRLACSFHHQRAAQTTLKRPCDITAETLREHELECERALVPLVWHSVDKLREWYGFEYEMLMLLARGDVRTFMDLAASGSEVTHHLDRYGLVRIEDGVPSLRIEVVAKYLRDPKRPTGPLPAPLTPQRDWLSLVTDVSRLRNDLEPRLRRFVKQTLRAHLGPEQWIDPILRVMGERQRAKTRGLDANTILDTHLHFHDLIEVIYNNWNYFASLERSKRHRLDREQMHRLLVFVNDLRVDAHAKPVAETDVADLSLVCRALNGALEEHLAN